MKIIISLIVLLLWSCTNQTSPVKTPYLESYIPASSYVYRGEKEVSGYGAYGYVLFASKPNSLNMRRYLKTAEAFLETLEDVSSYSRYNPKSLMVTFWPLTTRTMINSSSLVKMYDYSLSTSILSSIEKLNVNGPVLVAFENSYVLKNKHMLILDMSKFSDHEIKNAFLIWRNKISQDPLYWKNGFDFALIKIELRSFLNKYGDSILSIFSKELI